MRIGIDIDNCISNFDDTLLKEYLNHDKELRNTGIINEKAQYITKGMFDWSEEEEKSFYNANIERIAKELKPLKDAPYYIQKLKEENDIYIVSGRNNGEYKEPYKMTEEWLKNNNILYDKMILTNSNNEHEKTEVCIENNIDLMIEDSIRHCLDLKKNGIKVYTMNTMYNMKEQTLERVSSWKEIYEKIYNESKKEAK